MERERNQGKHLDLCSVNGRTEMEETKQAAGLRAQQLESEQFLRTGRGQGCGGPCGPKVLGRVQHRRNRLEVTGVKVI